MSSEKAVESILSALALSQSQKELILSEKCRTDTFFKKNGGYTENDYYSKGMEIFELEDNDGHNESTDMQMIKFADTPEKLLRYISEKAAVFAVSATAGMNTVLGNYNLAYLRAKLGPLYHPMDEQLYARVRSEYENICRPYRDGRVNVHIKTFAECKGSFVLHEKCRAVLNENEAADIAENLIRSCTSAAYEAARYCNILSAMRCFWEHDDIRSFLYLGMALPKKNNPSMDIDLLRKLMQLAAEDAGKVHDESSLAVLSGSTFDEDKDLILGELGSGKKRFVMSSYSTVGAGQNLQYSVGDKAGLIELTPYSGDGDRRHFTKDFDALYLGEITNVIVNTYSHEPVSKKDLLKMLVQTEELYSTGAMNFREKDKLIKLAFRAHCGNSVHENNDMYRYRDVRIKVTKDVVQAVGRINRTFLKNPDIYIFIDEKLLGMLEVGEIQKNIMSPEMESLAEMRKNMGKAYSEAEDIILNTAERISTEGMWRIRRILSRNWTEESMTFWKELRELVLRNPTADKKDIEKYSLISELYITSGTPQSGYLYSQYSDFSDVTLDFGNDEAAFRNSGRAKIKGGTNEVAVWKMSEEESGLPVILKYAGIREMFLMNGYAAEFADNLYMMSPVLFHNIYKGALGEIAGKFILENERGIKLRGIEDAERFEFFDFEMADGVYVDFKNWKFTYRQDEESICREIIRKLESIGGKRVYVINIVGNNYAGAAESADSRIIKIPALIDGNGKIIPEALDMIKEEDHRQ